MDAIDLLLTRRSVPVKDLAEPAPTESQLKTILTAATRVPDHGKLCPWRIVAFDKAAQTKLGQGLAAIYAKHTPDATEAQLAFEAARPTKAPLLLVVIFSPKDGKPVWEQQLSTGAVCMNLLHAAHARGFAGKWLTEWPAYDADAKTLIGCQGQEEVAGYIYIGTPKEVPADRERPDLDQVVSWWR